MKPAVTTDDVIAFKIYRFSISAANVIGRKYFKVGHRSKRILQVPKN
jgi:hypothetical protein